MELQKLIEHFFSLYGRRNRIFLSALRDRIDFLNLAIGDLQEAIRKELPNEILKIALARVVARIFCVAENFLELPLIKALIQKYPANHCSYCQKLPCQCLERRPAAKLVEVTLNEQCQWSLKKWCEHLNRVYGLKNKKKGIENIIIRLFKEISELISLSMRLTGSFSKISLEEIEKEFALELADALAWTIAIANLLEIDLEEAVLSRYGSGCWHCEKTPCQCTYFNVEPVRWLEKEEKNEKNPLD